jgi:hypothetical protein
MFGMRHFGFQSSQSTMLSAKRPAEIALRINFGDLPLGSPNLDQQ